MDDFPNPEGGAPENKEATAVQDAAPDNSRVRMSSAPQGGPDERNGAPAQNTYYQIGNPPQNAYAQNGGQTPGTYQQQPNAYQQRPNAYYQPQQNYQASAPGPYQQQNGYRQTNNYQPYQYQPGQYPPNPYPMPYGYYNNPARGKATASLVLGIISLVFCWMSFFAVVSVICSVIGIVLGNIARKQLPPDQGRGQATAGMVCSIIGLVLAILFIALFVFALTSLFHYSTDFGSVYGM